MSVLCVVVSSDNFLGANLSRIVVEEGLRTIRTATLDRVTRELKRPGRLAIVDVNWEVVQGPGVLRQLVNISRIPGNRILCICPNQEEDLKRLAAEARPDEVFIRYDLETRFRQWLKDFQIEQTESKNKL